MTAPPPFSFWGAKKKMGVESCGSPPATMPRSGQLRRGTPGSSCPPGVRHRADVGIGPYGCVTGGAQQHQAGAKPAPFCSLLPPLAALANVPLCTRDLWAGAKNRGDRFRGLLAQFSLLEVALQQALESLAVTGFVAGHRCSPHWQAASRPMGTAEISRFRISSSPGSQGTMLEKCH